MLKKIKTIVNYCSRIFLGRVLHDKLRCFRKMGYLPNLAEPKSFNEKLVSKKLFGDMKEAIILADKYAVRDFVKNRIGDSFLNEVFFIGDNPANIKLDNLPNRFVMKGTHGSGKDFIFIVKDKSEITEDILRKKAEYMLSHKIGYVTNEWWYSKIKPQIIIERFLCEPDLSIPNDYKFFVFSGKVHYIQVDFCRFTENHFRVICNRNWEHQNLEMFRGYPCKNSSEKPEKLDEMISVAEKLGQGFDFMRVDLYCVAQKEIIFGEMTPCPGSGTEAIIPVSFDYHLGSLWK